MIERRLAGAATELPHWAGYDYAIVNERLDESLARLQAILAAERARTSRQAGLGALVAGILYDLAARPVGAG